MDNTFVCAKGPRLMAAGYEGVLGVEHGRGMVFSD